MALLGSTWDGGGEAVSGKCLQKWRGKRKDTEREKEILLFYSFFPPSSISHWPSTPKAIVKGAGKCGVREKGGWGPTWKERGGKQNKEGTHQEKIRRTSTGDTNALREKQTELVSGNKGCADMVAR